MVIKKSLMVIIFIGTLALVTVGCTPQLTDRSFSASMSGEEGGIVTSATGDAIFTVSSDGTTINYRITVSDISNVTQAHIHLFPQGEILVWLYPDSPPPILIEGKFDGILAEGIITTEDLMGPLAGGNITNLVTLLEQGKTYVNVHTTQYPMGEIRGTIQ